MRERERESTTSNSMQVKERRGGLGTSELEEGKAEKQRKVERGGGRCGGSVGFHGMQAFPRMFPAFIVLASLLLAFSPSFFFLSSISIYNYNLSNKN
jgi:hypothetical protein